MTSTHDHYQVLEVTREATERVIKRSFFRLIQQYPPEQKPKEYQRLREAYDVLSNPVARREYDSMASFGAEIKALREEAEAILNEDEPDYDQAIRLLKKAVVLGPEIGILRDMLGLCFLEAANPYQALKQFNKASSIDPQNTTYLLHTGHALEALENFEAAEKVFRDAWRRDDEDYAAPRALASLLGTRDRIDEALDVLTQAIEADGKIDFQDFFCFYDKLHILLFSGRHDEMSRTLNRIVQLAERPKDREFAAFMLARSGAQLFDAKIFTLSRRFMNAAERLDPDNENLHEFAEVNRRLGKIEESLKSIQDSSNYHDLVIHMVQLRVAYYVDEIDDDLFLTKMKEVAQLLDDLMDIDPESSTIKASLLRVRKHHPEVFKLDKELYEALLKMSPAGKIAKPCPHCGQVVINLKRNLGSGQCPHCRGKLIFDGTSYTKPSNDCFIATAVYGSPNHPAIDHLRRFRDQTLTHYWAGQVFIRWYYRYGFDAARFVKPRVWLSTPLRGIISAFVFILKWRRPL